MKNVLGFALCGLAAMLAGCAAPGSVALNTSADALVQKLGKPTETRRNAQGGESWDYVYGPEGFETWRFGVDGGRTVRSAEQLLTYERLYKIVPGVTTEAGVTELLGKPRLVTRYSHEFAWEWRVNLLPNLGIFMVRFNPAGVALGVGVMTDLILDGSSPP